MPPKIQNSPKTLLLIPPKVTCKYPPFLWCLVSNRIGESYIPWILFFARTWHHPDEVILKSGNSASYSIALLVNPIKPKQHLPWTLMERSLMSDRVCMQASCWHSKIMIILLDFSWWGCVWQSAEEQLRRPFEQFGCHVEKATTRYPTVLSQS